MKQVAKVILIDERDYYLFFQRSDHPTFPNDPDLPGGTVEAGEQPIEALVREVEEEAGVTILPADTQLLYQGSNFSTHNTEYSLYVSHVAKRPEVTISWEHDSYAWVTRQEFLTRVHDAADTYMQMVYAALTKTDSI